MFVWSILPIAPFVPERDSAFWMEIPSVETLGYCHRDQSMSQAFAMGYSSSIKHSCVKIPTVRAKHCCELIAKRALPVVLCLIPNIRRCRLDSGNADAECSVALLPGEARQSRKCFVHPF